MNFLQVFTTPQGRCLQLARCLVQSSGVLVITHPAEGQPLMERLDRYVLYNDEVMCCCQQSLSDVLASPYICGQSLKHDCLHKVFDPCKLELTFMHRLSDTGQPNLP